MTFSPTQREELRKLAERARTSDRSDTVNVIMTMAHALFAEACSPATAFSLLDALDAAEGEVERLKEGNRQLMVAAQQHNEYFVRAQAAESRLTTLEEALREIEANSLSASSRRIARSALGEPG